MAYTKFIKPYYEIVYNNGFHDVGSQIESPEEVITYIYHESKWNGIGKPYLMSDKTLTVIYNAIEKMPVGTIGEFYGVRISREMDWRGKYV